MLLMSSGIFILIKPTQPLNALFPILITLFGKSIPTKLMQSEKAFWSIVKASSGTVTLLNSLQY